MTDVTSVEAHRAAVRDASSDAGVPAWWGAAPPTRRELIAAGATAAAIRIVFAVALMLATHTSLHGWAMLRDGESYLRIAAAVRGAMDVPNAFDWRVFPGYPLAIGVLGWTGIPLALVALVLTWGGAGVAAAAGGALFNRRDVAWALAVLLPGYLMYTSIAMSEGLLLGMMTVGLLLATRGRVVVGGLLLGYAGLIRPVACFAVIAFGIWSLHRRELRNAIVCGVTALVVVATGWLAWRGWSHGAAQSVALYNQAYGNRLLEWPFEALITTPLQSPVPDWKVAYIYSHVLLVLVACTFAIRRLQLAWKRRDARGDIGILAATWLLGNTLFAICVGQYWGFHEFHRFIVPALPALYVALEPLMPRRRVWWVAMSVASLAMAAFGLAY